MEINKVFLYGLILIILILSMYFLFRQISIHSVTSVKLTFFQKLKQSLVIGLMFGILIMSLFTGIFVYVQKDTSVQIHLHDLLMLGIIIIPVQIMVTMGAFIHFTYIDFLLQSGTKK
jgi:hypothetical protein